MDQHREQTGFLKLEQGASLKGLLKVREHWNSAPANVQGCGSTCFIWRNTPFCRSPAHIRFCCQSIVICKSSALAQPFYVGAPQNHHAAHRMIDKICRSRHPRPEQIFPDSRRPATICDIMYPCIMSHIVAQVVLNHAHCPVLRNFRTWHKQDITIGNPSKQHFLQRANLLHIKLIRLEYRKCSR